MTEKECLLCGIVVISLGMLVRHQRSCKPELLISELGESGKID